ncbi:MAG: CehA/McbA family metallohydrolase [Actinomycetes bacterium]
MNQHRPNPFESEGQWLKCALHTHSNVSDGTLPPHQLAHAYEEAGFDVLSITDHWRIAEAPSSDRLLTIPGAELGFDLMKPAYPHQSAEFLVWGIDHLPEDPGGDRANWCFNAEENWEVRTFPSLTDGASWAAEMGAVVYTAHPYWNQLSFDELGGAQGFSGIEVFNGSSDAEDGRGDSSPWWDALLGSGRTVFGIGTDDQHYPESELGLAWTMVKAADRTQEAVLGALRLGQSYLSHGPVIHHIEATDEGVIVECSPARTVRVQREHEHGTSVMVGRADGGPSRIVATDSEGLITRALLNCGPDALYRRVVVVDERGARAWSNPL